MNNEDIKETMESETTTPATGTAADSFPQPDFPEPIVPDVAAETASLGNAAEEDSNATGWVKRNGDWVFVPSAEDLEEIENASAPAPEAQEAAVVAAGNYFTKKAAEEAAAEAPAEVPVEEPTQFIDTGVGEAYENQDEADDLDEEEDEEEEESGSGTSKAMVITMIVLLIALIAMVGLFLYSYINGGATNSSVSNGISQISELFDNGGDDADADDEEQYTVGENMTTVVDGAIVTVTSTDSSDSDKDTKDSDSTTKKSSKKTTIQDASDVVDNGDGTTAKATTKASSKTTSKATSKATTKATTKSTTRRTTQRTTSDPDVEDIIGAQDGGDEEGVDEEDY